MAALLAQFDILPPTHAADSLVFESTKLTLYRQSTTQPLLFEVELARTPEQQKQGLMFRDKVPTGTGMFFSFPSPKPVTFWMKNTRVPLDMLFVASDGIINQISANAKPYDLTPLSSRKPVTGVLEIGGGEAKRLGIVIGDRIHVQKGAHP
ncbi:MAG: DUF192 domain-containing protein [Bdellovibrionales bacterium]